MSWNIDKYFSSKAAAYTALLTEKDGVHVLDNGIPPQVRSIILADIDLVPDTTTPHVVHVKSFGHYDAVNCNATTEVTLIHLD
jgi:hypothetical protein